VVLFLLMVTSCRQHTYNSVLTAADSIMEDSPDSAYTMLQTITDVSKYGDESNRTYYNLLNIQACYKLYKPTPHDSVIRSVVNYYQQSDDKSLLCRAYYYRAMTLYESGKHDEALVLLKTGEQLATSIHDVLQLSKYHESLCMVNFEANCNDLMLKYAQLFLGDAIMLKDTVLISRGFDHVSTSYFRMGKVKESEDYVLKTLPLLHKMSNTGRAHILTNLACTLHANGHLNQAKRFLLLSLKEYPLANTYAELGDILIEEDSISKAEQCWEKALMSKHSTIVANALTSMYRLNKEKGKHIKALDVLERLTILKDSINHASEQAQLAEIQYKYDKQVVEKRFYQLLAWSFGAALFTIIIVYCLVRYHRHTVKSYSNQLMIMEESIICKQRQIAALEYSGEEHQEEIKALQRQIIKLREQSKERLGIGKRIYDKIILGNHLSPTDDEHCLVEYFSVIHFEIYNQWMHDYQGLSARQIVILMLLNMGKNDAEIAQILCVTQGAVRTNKSRIKAKKTSRTLC